MFCVYILQSVKNKRYYIGSTDNVSRRIDEHNAGYVQATRNTRPFQLRVVIECLTLTEARKSEQRLKKYKRKDILTKVIKDKMFPWEYTAPIA